MRRTLTVLFLLVAMTSLPSPVDVPVALADYAESFDYVSPEGNLCEPNRTVPDGCIPSPMQCAEGGYDGSWISSIDGRTATCIGGGWHITEYVGGVPHQLCGAVIRDDRVVAGSWRDPNQVCGAYGVGSGNGIKGNRYKPAVVGRSGAVSSSAPDASAAGIDVLEGGGNAVDAAVAMVFAVGVVAPESCGIGGGGFLLYRGADGTTAALDFREKAPAGLPVDFESRSPTLKPGTGHLVVGVPGTVAGMAAAQARYGSKPLKRLLQPAIDLAQRGIRWTPKQADSVAINKDRLERYEASAAQFLVKDAEGGYRAPPPYPVSQLWKQPDLVGTLGEIAAGGAKAFYRGPIAQKIVDEMNRSRKAYNLKSELGEDLMTANDLASYQAVWRTPLRGTYRGQEILAMPPPTAGGIVTLATLNLIEDEKWLLRKSTDGAGFDHSSADHLHLLAEAKKLAWADRDGYVADPDYAAVPTGQLISKEYADERRDKISMTEAREPTPGSLPGFTPATTAAASDGPNTHHISVIDAAGNAVAVTCTIEQGFGSAVVVPGAGFLLNSQLTDFDEPVYPIKEKPEENKNAPAAGKRPRSSMSPTIVVADGRPRLVLGGVGGSSIPMGVVLAISNVLDYNLEEAHALDAARVDAESVGGHMCCTIGLEDHRVPEAARKGLVDRGHTIDSRAQYDVLFRPVVQMVGFKPDGRQFAASDPRYDGGAKVREPL